MLFFNSFTGVGSWIWSYYDGNLCPPSAHCAGCLVTEGVTQRKGCKTIPSCPQSRITHSWVRWQVRCLLWILQKTTKFHQRKGNSFGKETGFGVRCCLTGHPSAFLEKKLFQAPREGRVTSTALQSQRIAERQDCAGTSMNNCTGFWSPYTPLVLLPGLMVFPGG